MNIEITVRPYLILLAGLIAASMIIVLTTNGLNEAYPTFHYTDELNYHYPAIQLFASQITESRIDPSDYSSATAPLFHVLFATLSSAFDFDLVSLRFVNAAISLLVPLVIFSTLHTQLDYQRSRALILAFIFGVSPYYFGASFVLLTDSISFLWIAICIKYMLVYQKTQSNRAILVVMLCFLLASLTRQLNIWLFIPICYCIISANTTNRTKAWQISLMLLALTPLAALIAIWGGLTPPAFQIKHTEQGSINTDALIMMFSLVTVYVIYTKPNQIIEILATSPAFTALIFLISSAWLILLPVTYKEGLGYDGYLWTIASKLPNILGSNSLFWILFPAGIAVAIKSIQNHTNKALGFAMLAPFITINLVNSTSYQKYYDPYIFLILLMGSGLGKTHHKFDNTAMAVCIVLFLIFDFRHCF